MGTYRNENRQDQWRADQGWRPGDNDRDRDRDRDRGERERLMGERGEVDDRYSPQRFDRNSGDQRMGGRDDGRYGRGGDDGGRFGYGGASGRGQQDEDRQRYGRGGEDDYSDRGRQGYGYGGQSGAQAGYGGGGYGRESTGYGRDEGGYGRARMGGGGAYETTGYGYGGGMGMMNEGRGNVGDREGYQYRDRGGMGYGERGGGFGGGMAGGQSYGGVSSGRERDLGAYRNEGSWRGEAYGNNQGARGEGGGHRGKGPSGYTRSDDRVKEDVCQALQDDDDIDASHIEITVKSGEVTLSGYVNDRRTKRMAEDCVERVPGVKDVSNNIRVQAENTSSNTGNGRTAKSESVSSSPDKDTESAKRPRA